MSRLLILGLLVIGNRNLSDVVADNSIVLRQRTPDMSLQEYACPNQNISLECSAMIPDSFLWWTFPSGELRYSEDSDINDVKISHDGQFIATLTERSISDGGGYRMNSTLLILTKNFVNMSTVECSGGNIRTPVKNNTTIILSGFPDSPVNVTHGVSESVVNMQWSRPSYTGSSGVSVVTYTISNNAETVVVSTNSNVVKYTSPSLIYGEVFVAAINSCGQPSKPVSHTIPAEEPPKVEVSIEMVCDASLENGRSVKISWKSGARKPDVVYPGEEKVTVELNPGAIECHLQNGNTCVTTLTRERDYQFNIAMTNKAGTTLNVYYFNTSQVDEVDIEESDRALSITVTPQQHCVNKNYSISVCFGRQDISGEGKCDTSNGFSDTKDNIQPGQHATFTVNTSVFPLPRGQVFCYNVSMGNTAPCESKRAENRADTNNVYIVVTVILIVLAIVITIVTLGVIVRRINTRKRMTRILASQKASHCKSLTTNEMRDAGYEIIGSNVPQEQIAFEARNMRFKPSTLVDREHATDMISDSTDDKGTEKEPTPPPLPSPFLPSISPPSLSSLPPQPTHLEIEDVSGEGVLTEEKNTAEGKERKSAAEYSHGTKKTVYTAISVSKPSSTGPLLLEMASEQTVTYSVITRNEDKSARIT